MNIATFRREVVAAVNEKRPDVVGVDRLLLDGLYERQGVTLRGHRFEPIPSGIETAVEAVLKPEHAWALEVQAPQ